MTTREIEVIQCMRPNGRRVPITTDVPENVFKAYNRVTAAGMIVTAENIDQMISFCLEHPEYGDFDQTLVPNGPKVPVKLGELLLRFDEETFAQWCAQNEESA
jgi:hypothetical protein